MGLAASQSRWLSLTSRLSDLELRAGVLSNTKIRLATHESDASRAYTAELDRHKMTVYNATTDRYVSADLENLTSYYGGDATDTVQRLITDSNGNLIVNDDVANAYDGSNGNLERFLNGMHYTSVRSLDEYKNNYATALRSNAGFVSTTKNTLKTTALNELTASVNAINVTSTNYTSTTYSGAYCRVSYNDTAIINAPSNATRNKLNYDEVYTLAEDHKSSFLVQPAACSVDPNTVGTNFATLITDYTNQLGANLIGNLSSKGIPTDILTRATNYAGLATFNKFVYNKIDTDSKDGVNMGNASGTGATGSLSSYLNNLVYPGTTRSGINIDPYVASTLTAINGAALGGIIGTLIAPGIGTAIGGAIGGVVGFIGGLIFGTNSSSGTSGQNNICAQSNYTTSGFLNLTKNASLQVTVSGKELIDTYLTFFDQYMAQNYGGSTANTVGTEHTTRAARTGGNSTQPVGYSIGTPNVTTTPTYASTNGTKAGEMKTLLNTVNTKLTQITSIFPSLAAAPCIASLNFASVKSAIDAISDNNATLTQAQLKSVYDIKAAISLSISGALSTAIDSASLSEASLSTAITENVRVNENTLSQEYASNTYDAGAVTYYTNIFNKIKAANGGTWASERGYREVSDDVWTNPTWLQTQIEAGNLYLYTDKNRDGTFENVSWTTGDSTLTEQDDTSGIARAKAQYDTSMNEIKTKETKLDLELKQIDTEHSAVQSEIDSVKKVIDKNIERTFKMFDA